MSLSQTDKGTAFFHHLLESFDEICDGVGERLPFCSEFLTCSSLTSTHRKQDSPLKLKE